MSGLFDVDPALLPHTADLSTQLAEAERELRMRGRVYERMVAKGQLRLGDARHQLAAQAAIVTTLRRLVEAPAPCPALVAAMSADELRAERRRWDRRLATAVTRDAERQADDAIVTLSAWIDRREREATAC